MGNAPLAPMQPIGQPNPQVAAWFQQADTRRNGQIDAGELRCMLTMQGLNLPLPVCQKIVSVCDRDRSGQLGLQEVQHVFMIINNCKAKFAMFDCDRSGNLSLLELGNALRAIGYSQLNPQAVQALQHRFDFDRSGRITFNEFIGCVVFVEHMHHMFRQTHGAYTPMAFNQQLVVAARA